MKTQVTKQKLIIASASLLALVVFIIILVNNRQLLQNSSNNQPEIITSRLQSISSISAQTANSKSAASSTSVQTTTTNHAKSANTFELVFTGGEFAERAEPPADRYKLSYDSTLGFKYSPTQSLDANSATFLNADIRIDLRLVDSGSYAYLAPDTLKMDASVIKLNAPVANSEWGNLYRYFSEDLGVFMYGAKLDNSSPKTLEKYVKVQLAYDFFTMQITCAASASQAAKCDQFVAKLRNVL